MIRCCCYAVCLFGRFSDAYWCFWQSIHVVHGLHILAWSRTANVSHTWLDTDPYIALHAPDILGTTILHCTSSTHLCTRVHPPCNHSACVPPIVMCDAFPPLIMQGPYPPHILRSHSHIKNTRTRPISKIDGISSTMIWLTVLPRWHVTRFPLDNVPRYSLASHARIKVLKLLLTDICTNAAVSKKSEQWVTIDVFRTVNDPLDLLLLQRTNFRSNLEAIRNSQSWTQKLKNGNCMRLLQKQNPVPLWIKWYAIFMKIFRQGLSR